MCGVSSLTPVGVNQRGELGELVRYLQLAHNERGVPVARVIHNVGREDLLDREESVRKSGVTGGGFRKRCRG